MRARAHVWGLHRLFHRLTTPHQLCFHPHARTNARTLTLLGQSFRLNFNEAPLAPGSGPLPGPPPVVHVRPQPPIQAFAHARPQQPVQAYARPQAYAQPQQPVQAYARAPAQAHATVSYAQPQTVYRQVIDC